MKMWRAILVCGVITLVLASCTKDKSTGATCPNCPDTISFKAVIIPIFQASCAIAGCHDATTDAFSMNLDSAHAYFNSTKPGTGNVYPGNAGNSLLYNIVASGGMPLHLPHISSCETQDIECWINQGALNN